MVRDGRRVFCSFCMFFLLGFLVEETLCEHGENMQTPHRKAREIAHLSTEGLGRTCPSEPTAPDAGIDPCWQAHTSDFSCSWSPGLHTSQILSKFLRLRFQW